MLSPEQIEKLKSENPDAELRKVQTKAGIVVVRTPRQGDWKRMQDEAAKPEKRAEAMRALVRSSVVFPSKEEFLRMLEKRPGIFETLLPIVQEMGGIEDEVQGELL